ncbi:MAG: PrsW family intramembrane metalloprotease [Polyangiaceae bacterium]|nr:PrsW family intramembrane metalloprotease [Polyangiaceae bacterium]
MALALGLALGALPLLAAFFIWRRLSAERRVPRRYALTMTLGGGAAGALAFLAERLVLEWTGLSLRASEAGAAGALMVTFLFVAPLGEAAKVLVVWPLFAARELTTRRLGLAYAACAGAGFAAVDATLAMQFAPRDDSLFALRVAAALPAHPFFAGLWGYSLGRGRGRWFSLAWASAAVGHGLLVHIVFGRGAGLLAAALPLLLAMGAVSWVLLREVSPASASRSRRLGALAPPSLSAMRRALAVSDRPVMLHWIAIGALVTLGVVIAFLVGAVALGHFIGLDFSHADESDLRASGPLVLLGVAGLLAFPFAGYLVARASGATSVLEPALGSALAIAGAVLLLSVTVPVAVLVALAVAPVAFALACSGAWFGLERVA